jgi:preprotein translocase subunit SecA
MPTVGGEATIATSPSGAPPRPAAKAAPAPRTATGEKVGRNDPCYCGSGKKYKKCHYLEKGRA